MKLIEWKSLGKRLLFLPGWLMLILTAFSAAGLVFVFLRGLDAHPIGYTVYVLAFYTLCVDTVFCVLTLLRYYRRAKNMVYANHYGNRYMTDPAFKTHVSLYTSLALNLAYVVSNLLSGLLHSSVWSITLAAYYMILAVMRFLLLRFFNRDGVVRGRTGKDRLPERRRSRLCSIILLTLNFALSGMIVLVIAADEGFAYGSIMIYVMAMYTFYTVITTVRDLFRYRKHNSPVLTASKVIKMAAALVSLLSLEIAMLTQFSDDSNPEYFNNVMIGATGAAVSIIVVFMAVYTIVKTTKEIHVLMRT